MHRMLLFVMGCIAGGVSIMEFHQSDPIWEFFGLVALVLTILAVNGVGRSLLTAGTCQFGFGIFLCFVGRADESGLWLLAGIIFLVLGAFFYVLENAEVDDADETTHGNQEHDPVVQNS